jgi:hypothetical protein
MLWVAAGLTLITGYDYLRGGLKHMSATSVSTYADYEPLREPPPTKARASEPGGA